MKKLIVSILAATLIFPLSAQTKDVELKLTLRDGNVVSGTSKIASIVLITEYGKLDVPIKNISSLDVGISANKTLSDKIENLIKQLANSNEQLRKMAYEELANMEINAIPAISIFLSSSKYEPSEYTDYIPEVILGELKAKFNVDDTFSTDDIISIDYQYSIGGKYDFDKIDLKTQYGTLSIPKGKIKHIDVMYSSGVEGDEMIFKLQGSKHISSNPTGGWLNTGIMIKAGQKLNIAATGEVVFASLSGSKYKPDGTISGTSVPLDAGYEGDYNSGSTYPSYGNVVFKIGENSTQVLRAGAKFNGNVQSNGMLFLSIYETVYSAANTGTYTVKIKVK